MNINQSKTCAYCGEVFNDRENIIHLGCNGCFQLEIVSDRNYGDEAKLHSDCFNKLTRIISLEERMQILTSDESLLASVQCAIALKYCYLRDS